LENLKTKFNLTNIAAVRDLQIITRSVSGRITRLAVQYVDSRGANAIFTLADQYDIRRALHPSFLFSSAFIMQIEKDGASNVRSLLLNGAGWGHGVGLCQIGALGMALKGCTYQAILRHYYPETTLIKAY
jgi:SpoIID/LytB domain protein